jgi:hypothetical protein
VNLSGTFGALFEGSISGSGLPFFLRHMPENSKSQGFIAKSRFRAHWLAAG